MTFCSFNLFYSNMRLIGTSNWLCWYGFIILSILSIPSIYTKLRKTSQNENMPWKFASPHHIKKSQLSQSLHYFFGTQTDNMNGITKSNSFDSIGDSMTVPIHSTIGIVHKNWISKTSNQLNILLPLYKIIKKRHSKQEIRPWQCLFSNLTIAFLKREYKQVQIKRQ